MWKRWASVLQQLAHILHWVTMKVFSHQSRKIYAENKRWVFYFLNPVQKCQINYTWTRYMRSQMMATKNQFHVCTSTSCINVQIRRRWMIYIPDRYYIQISHQVLQFGLQGESRYHKIIVIKHDPITGLSGVPYKFAVTTDHKKNWVTNLFGGEQERWMCTLTMIVKGASGERFTHNKSKMKEKSEIIYYYYTCSVPRNATTSLWRRMSRHIATWWNKIICEEEKMGSTSWLTV